MQDRGQSAKNTSRTFSLDSSATAAGAAASAAEVSVDACEFSCGAVTSEGLSSFCASVSIASLCSAGLSERVKVQKGANKKAIHTLRISGGCLGGRLSVCGSRRRHLLSARSRVGNFLRHNSPRCPRFTDDFSRRRMRSRQAAKGLKSDPVCARIVRKKTWRRTNRRIGAIEKRSLRPRQCTRTAAPLPCSSVRARARARA